MNLRLPIALIAVVFGISVSAPTLAKAAGPMRHTSGRSSLKLTPAQVVKLREFNLKEAKKMHAFVKNHPRDYKAYERFQKTQGAESAAFMHKLLTPAQRKILASQQTFTQSHPRHPAAPKH